MEALEKLIVWQFGGVGVRGLIEPSPILEFMYNVRSGRWLMKNRVRSGIALDATINVEQMRN
jgi:hypothetical protein